MTAPNLDGLDSLDGERPGEPFAVQAGGRVVVFRPAAGPGWRDLLEAMAWPPAFMASFGPDDPGDVAAIEALPVGGMRVLLRGWRLHHGLCTDDADHMRLVSMLAKPAYRGAAERDLWHHARLDLNTEWQARRWRRLLNLLDGMPRASHISEAMAQDDELAELYLEREHRGDVDNAVRRRVSEFSLEAELLSYTVDRLGELLQAHAAGRGARPRRVEPMPRPETAVHRIRNKRTQRKHQYTVARVFGYIDAQGQPTGRRPPESPPTL